MAGDQHWYSKVLGIHCDGTNGSTTFTDVKGNAVTAVGNTQMSTSQYPALTGKTSSAYFDGSSDCLTIPNSSSLYLGSSDFCIKMMYLPDASLVDTRLYSHGEIGGTNWPILELLVASNGALALRLNYQNANSSTIFSSSPGAVVSGVWNRIEVDRSGTTIKGFVNETEVFSGSWNNTLWNSGVVVRIGAFNNAGSLTNSAKGYLSEIEVYKGIALNTAGGFDAPTEPFGDEYVYVSGTTKNSSGTLASRLVRVYRQDTGAFVGEQLSNATTGAYKITAANTGATVTKHFVVMHDDDANPPTTTENALIYDDITPA
jgi:hypothetical protein